MTTITCGTSAQDPFCISDISELFETGRQHYNSGEYAKAAGCFYAVFLRNPYDKEARKALDKSYEKLGKKPVVKPELYLAPLNELFKWTGLAFVLTSALLGLLNIFKLKKNLLIATVMAMTISVAFFYEGYNLEKNQRTEKLFVLSSIPLRNDPLYGSSDFFELHPGDVVSLKETRGTWLKVRFERAEGWILDDYVMKLN